MGAGFADLLVHEEVDVLREPHVSVADEELDLVDGVAWLGVVRVRG